MAERSYPTLEVRGGDERSYPASEIRGGGWEELPHARKPEARGRPGGPTPRPRSRGCAGTGGPSYPTLKVKKGGGEEIPLV